ncbi:MAG: transglycosylase SLT domain-containing protein [Actinomycetota bacterium]
MSDARQVAAASTPSSLLVTSVGGARGGDALAAAIAVAAAEGERPTLLIEVGLPARARRATLLASPAARELEERLAGTAAGDAVARGLVCQLGLPVCPEVLDRAAAAVELLPRSGACVLHVAPNLWQEALAHRGLCVRGALLRAELPRDRALVSLAVRDLHHRGVCVRVASRGPGWAAARRALAGVRVGGPEEPRLRRWSRLLLGAGGQALPAVVGAIAILMIGVLAVVSIAGALTGKGRLQRAADLAALSAARSMRDDLPRVTAPARLPDGSVNPARIGRAEYLRRARSAALRAADANGADPQRVRIRFPDAEAFPPLRARVTLVGELEAGDEHRAGSERREPVVVYAVAEATAPAGGAADLPAYASGGGYSGPLAYRQGKPMRPDVAAAFDRMAAAASRAGLVLTVTSGFRSDAEQAELFAAHPDPTWVAPPGQSLHRCATELDLGPPGAYAWLAANARRFGFLRRYSWEAWHFGYIAGPPPCSAAGELAGPGGSAADPRADGAGGLPEFVPVRFRGPLLRSAARWNVSAALLAAQLMAESGFDPGAVSFAGAQGIAQFMPSTAASYGLRNPFDPEAAIDAQAHLMSDLLRSLGSVRLALAAYNAGEGAVAGCRCIPPYPETVAYVARILALLDGAGALISPPFEVRLVE